MIGILFARGLLNGHSTAHPSLLHGQSHFLLPSQDLTSHNATERWAYRTERTEDLTSTTKIRQTVLKGPCSGAQFPSITTHALHGLGRSRGSCLGALPTIKRI
jgi:hypothetical protein